MNEYREADERGRELAQKDFGGMYHIEWTTTDTCEVDLYATANTRHDRTYVGDVKAYIDEAHPRRFDKFPNYMIDYQKLRHITDIAIAEDRIPVLIVYFEECVVVWNLFKSDWENNTEMRWVNKDGQHYGEKKEFQKMAYLNKSEAVYYRMREKNRDDDKK